jgi:predicted nucleic acid-binding protein
MMDQVYLDSNILIACYAGDSVEASRKILVEQAFKAFAELKDVQLCTSMWALAEAYKVLLSRKKMKREDVSVIETQLLHEKRLLNAKLKLVDVSPESDYDFDEFFFHVRQAVVSYPSGIADIIHSVIMKNNAITTILTFDEKMDFRQIPGLTVLHPRDVHL